MRKVALVLALFLWANVAMGRSVWLTEALRWAAGSVVTVGILAPAVLVPSYVCSGNFRHNVQQIVEKRTGTDRWEFGYGEYDYPHLLPTPTTRNNFYQRDDLYSRLDTIGSNIYLSPIELETLMLKILSDGLHNHMSSGIRKAIEDAGGRRIKSIGSYRSNSWIRELRWELINIADEYPDYFPKPSEPKSSEDEATSYE